MRILVAGVGNVLRGDDGFGVEVARRLSRMELPEGVRVVETGIAGIALVQEFQAGCDAAIVVDTVDLGRKPGTVLVIVPEVIDVYSLSLTERHDLLADMHLANPERVLMLANALGVLPPTLRLVACQLTDPEAVSEVLTPAVAAAVDIAVAEVLAQIEQFTAAATGAAMSGEP